MIAIRTGLKKIGIKRRRMKNIKTIFMLICFILLANTTALARLSTDRPDTEPDTEMMQQVTDCTGRVVAVPKKVERIACLYAFAGHVVTMMGRGDAIVAVSRGLKRDTLLHDICPTILNTRVPKAQGGINSEELLRAKPDLVFLSAEVGRNHGEVAKLDTLNIPYLIVDYKSIKEQQDAVAMIATVLNTTAKANAYIHYYNEVMQIIHQGVSAIPAQQRPTVFHSVNEANRTAIPKSLSTGWLDVLGVKNVAAGAGKSMMNVKQYVTMEQILLWNPDIILVNEPRIKLKIQSDRKWAKLKAVKHKKVYLMPIAISRWGHPGSLETPLALYYGAKTIYPGVFQAVDMRFETRRFYQDFFNHILTEKEVTQILSGKLKRKPKRRG